MKKMTKILLVGIMAVCLLSGCYKQDTTIKVKPSGKVDASISMIGSDEAIAQASGGSSFNELAESLMPQIESFKENDSMTAETVSEQIGDKTYQGVKITAKYKDVSEMLNSMYFMAFNSSVVVPVEGGASGDTGNGLTLKEITSPFGNTYTINGIISYAQGQENTLTEDELKQIEASQVNMKFKFPVLSWSNGKIIAPSYSYSVNKDNPSEEVHVWVFVPNFILLLALLIIIGLLIAVIILASRLSKLSPKGDGPEFDTFADNFEETLSEDDQNFFEGFDEEETSETTPDETAEDIEENE